ncbi:site-2 protease family protein [Pseudorhodoplanes sp.]|uniref:site-2 protease family protein n=1 Tax=Pseudorhodoplanes sp. TaxID=1934341 RepID=UPI002C8558F9|nr:site-2 protease family protein [Pseudorhodoplanes sp.]HWV53757.1 site-2 protease family protein [Pseudorhodoplanes sp.]
MGWSVTVGSIAGTAVRIHITFLLFLVWIFGAAYASGGASAGWTSLIFIILVFLCVLAHEFGHIFTARAFGVITPDVVLLPIGGVARLERIPEKPIEEFLIAIAGPLVNVVIAGALLLFAGADVTSNAAFAALDNTKIPMVDKLAAVNLFLALFNLIPAFPMDGGRVLRAALSARLGFVRATEIAAAIGQGAAFLLGFIGLFYNPILIFIAIFVYLAASSEAHMVALRAVSRGVPVVTATMTKIATLSPDAPIENAVEVLLQTSQSEFPVVDGDHRPVGLLTRSDIIRGLKDFGPQARVSEAMTTDVVSLDRRRPLEEAVKLLQERSVPAVAVIEPDGRLVGLITTETLGELMMVSQAMPEGFSLGGKAGPWGRTAGAG